MTQAPVAPAKTRAQISERTLRKDRWWREPRITAAALTIWVAYACVHVFIGRWYWVPRYHYLTPFYSPCVSGACAPGASSLGTWFPKVPSIIPYAIVACRSSWASGSAATTTARPTTGRSTRPGGLRGPRAARQLQRRDQVPADHAEPAPVLLLRGHPGLDPEHLRPDPGVPRPERQLRDRSRHADHGRQRGAAMGLHAVLPLLPAHHRRPAASTSPSTRCGTGYGPRSRS